MRITKDLANQIAFKLTEKSRLVVEAEKIAYQTLVTELYEKETPTAVRECFAKHPEWFSTRSNISFSGHGFRWESIKSIRRVIPNIEGDARLTLTQKIADQLHKAQQKFEKADKFYKDLKQETETALVNLGTYKRIEENIPEAKKYLPPPMSNALVVNMDSLNKKLAKQPEIKAVTA